MQRERQRHRQRENQAPCEELDAGLNSRIPGSQPEPIMAHAQPPSHPGAPLSIFIAEGRNWPEVRRQSRDGGRVVKLPCASPHKPLSFEAAHIKLALSSGVDSAPVALVVARKTSAASDLVSGEKSAG